MEFTISSEAYLIQGTIGDIEEAIERLKEQRKLIDEELREKSERLLAWKTRLAKLESGEEIQPKKKRRKGENLRTIADLFAKQAGRGMAASEIAQATNIPWSSVRVVLNGKRELFYEKSGLWYMSKEPESVNKNGDGKRIAP